MPDTFASLDDELFGGVADDAIFSLDMLDRELGMDSDADIAAMQARLLLKRAKLSRRQALRPPPVMKVDAWADQYRRLSSEAGSTGGKWRTSTVEVARGPYRAVTEPGVRIITLMSCTQLLKTSFIENVTGYFIHLDPCPMLLLQPKDEAATAFSKERLAPMISATPALSELVGDRRTRVSDDTLGYKKFPGGFLVMASAGSPTNLAMRAIRVTMLDEIDKYEPTKEGDSVKLAEERTDTFTANSLKIRTCSPTLEDTSRINKSYVSGDQRQPYVECPHCHESYILDFFENVRWPQHGEGSTKQHITQKANVWCHLCGTEWSEIQRLDAISKVQWRQTKPFVCCDKAQDPQIVKKWEWDEENLVGYACCEECGERAVSNEHASFNVGKLLSPWQPMKVIAGKWMDSKDDEEDRQTFYNTQLGKVYSPSTGKKLASDALMRRRERWEAEVTDGCACLTAGIDVQDDRLEIEVTGWGRDEESWSLAYEVFYGDPDKPDVWTTLDEYLQRKFTRADGRQFVIEAACVDTGGHHTQAAYSFAKARLGRKIYGIKGASDRFGKNSPVWPASRLQVTKSSYKPVIIGVNAAKDRIRSRLIIDKPGPGYCHFPSDRDAPYFEQLLSEKYVIKKERGHTYREWELSKGKANEALDARVYSYAALCSLIRGGFKLNKRAEIVGAVNSQVVILAGAEEVPPPVVTENVTDTVGKPPKTAKVAPVGSRLGRLSSLRRGRVGGFH